MAALTACPTWGRMATRSSANARSVPSRASVDIAPAMSATRSSTSRSARASTTMPSIPSVPLISARPSLARSTSGADAGLGQRGRPADERTVGAPGLALAEQHEGRRRQGREVAARPERAVLAHDRRHAGVEQGEHRLDDHRPGPGEAHRQAAGTQQDHGPHDLPLDLGAHPGGVRAHERRLQLGRALGGDHRVGEGAEARSRRRRPARPGGRAARRPPRRRRWRRGRPCRARHGARGGPRRRPRRQRPRRDRARAGRRPRRRT